MLSSNYEKLLSKLSDSEKIQIVDYCIQRHAEISGKKKLPRQWGRFKDDSEIIQTELKRLAHIQTAPGKAAADFFITGKDLHAAIMDVNTFAWKLRNIMKLPSFMQRKEGKCNKATKRDIRKRDHFIDQLIISVIEITAGIDVRLMYQNNKDDDFSLSKHDKTFSKQAALIIKAVNRRSIEILESSKEILNASQSPDHFANLQQQVNPATHTNDGKKVATLVANFNEAIYHKSAKNKPVNNAKTPFRPKAMGHPQVKLTIR